jgi:hypothetical protein
MMSLNGFSEQERAAHLVKMFYFAPFRFCKFTKLDISCFPCDRDGNINYELFVKLYDFSKMTGAIYVLLKRPQRSAITVNTRTWLLFIVLCRIC